MLKSVFMKSINYGLEIIRDYTRDYYFMEMTAYKMQSYTPFLFKYCSSYEGNTFHNRQ